jgi:hypothetical protein
LGALAFVGLVTQAARLLERLIPERRKEGSAVTAKPQPAH